MRMRIKFIHITVMVKMGPTVTQVSRNHQISTSTSFVAANLNAV